ncbi:MAG TPA: hypothetical protein VGD40_13830 [Chryseosolibacter sp.]
MIRGMLFFMLISCQTVAQSFSERLQQRLDDYYQHVIPLMVHVFTNQPEYAAGDTIFFNVNVITAQGHHPVAGKSIISIALLDENNTALIVNRFAIANGAGSNQMILPKSFPSGHYWLAAWTDWMAAEKHRLHRTRIRVGTSITTPTKLVVSPEGGSLIHGLNGRVVVIGAPFTSGHLVENGDRILAFTTGSDGTTSLYVSPKVGLRYEVISGNNRIALPDVKADGVGITVTPIAEKKAVRTHLTVPEVSAYRERGLHVVMSQQGIIYSSADIVFRNQTFLSLDFSFDQVPRGIAQITVFDDDGRVVTERLVYNSFASRAIASVVLPKMKFQTREKIDVHVIVKAGQAPIPSLLSATIFHAAYTPLDTTTAHTLITDMEFYANVGDVDLKFGAKAKTSTIDNKLVVSRWRKFDWDSLSTPKKAAYHSQYLTYRGQAFDIQTHAPVPDSSRITFFLQRDVTTYEAYTNAAGQFSVSMLVDFYNNDEVFYRVEHGGELLDGARVQIDQHSAGDTWPNSPVQTKTIYTDLFEKRARVAESYDYHLKESQAIASAAPHLILEDEIFGPDLTVTMNDYHLFPTMIETLREVIPVAQHRKIRGREVVRVFNQEAKEFYNADPVYVVDGVMTDDIDYFLSLNPADIETIKLVHKPDKLRIFGAVGKGGIFIVDTRLPDNHTRVQRSVRSLTLQGLNEPMIRKTVDHLSREHLRVPDFRTNLLWLPSLQTDSAGRASMTFYASDVPGKYKVFGEGITGDGKLFTFEDEFEVVFDNK